MTSSPEWLTLTEAAQRWGITANALRLRIHRHTIPMNSIRKSGGTWLISTAGMVELFGERRSENSPTDTKEDDGS